MTNWIEYSKQKPEEGKDLWYFFDIVGVHKGQYYGCGEFAGDKGFLRYDVTHWQYDVGQDRPERPTDTKQFYGCMKEREGFSDGGSIPPISTKNVFEQNVFDGDALASTGKDIRLDNSIGD